MKHVFFKVVKHGLCVKILFLGNKQDLAFKNFAAHSLANSVEFN